MARKGIGKATVRVIAGIVIASVVAVAAIAIARLYPLLSLGTAYAAKTVCSGTFVSRRTPESVPDDAYYMLGHEGQMVAIVPSEELVVVRLGLSRYPEAWNHRKFLESVLITLEPVASE